jgi:hypothetical protein
MHPTRLTRRASRPALWLASVSVAALAFRAAHADPQRLPAATVPATAPVATAPAATASAASRPVVATQPYVWRQVNDAAGGDCAGLYFHPQDASIRYATSARGGGGQLWDFPGQRWVAYTVRAPDAAGEVSPDRILGMAVDRTDRNVVYVAAGGRHAEVFRSVDRGKTFVAAGLRRPGGGRVDGDAPGTGWPATGERLTGDPNNPAVLYFASPRDGLFRTARAGVPESWEPVPLPGGARGPVVAAGEQVGDDPRRPPPVRLTAVAIDPGGGTVDTGGVRRSRVLYVGVATAAGDRNPAASTRPATAPAPLAGVWRTADGGDTWARLAAPPAVADVAPHRMSVRRDGTLWATVAGRVVKAPRDTAALTDVSPPATGPADKPAAAASKPGTATDAFVALAVDAADPQHVVVARFGAPPADGPAYGDANRLYRSADAGQTWRPVAAAAGVPPWAEAAPDTGRFATRTELLRFEPNAPADAAGRTRTLWLGDALGPWVCQDLDADVTNWKLVSRGRGGGFASAMGCPPALAGAAVAPLFAGGNRHAGGPAVGGFRYLNVSAVPERPLTFNDRRDGHGLGEVASIDVCESDPRVVAAVGGWGSDTGINPPYAGGGVSTDNGVTWTPFGDNGDGLNEPGLGGTGGPGEVAVGADRPPGGGPDLAAAGFPDIVWVPNRSAPRRSTDGGRTWADAAGTFGRPAASPSQYARTLAADPVDGRTFYRFAEDDLGGRWALFASTDGGATWDRRGVVPADRGVGLSTRTVLRACPGRPGDLWLSLDDLSAEPGRLGLYRSADGGRTWGRVGPWRRTFGFAFGAPAPGRLDPSLALAAESPDGRLGIYLSDDPTTPLPAGGAASAAEQAARATWRTVWDLATADVPAVVGCLRSIGADRQSYGRIYAGATAGGRGLYYGEPEPSTPPAPPTNVTATPVPGGVKVEWSDPIGAAEYDVQRAAAAGPGSATAPVATRAATGPATRPAASRLADAGPAEWRTVVTAAWQARFVDTTADPRAAYLYRVVASNAFGRSDPSAPARAGARQ